MSAKGGEIVPIMLSNVRCYGCFPAMPTDDHTSPEYSSCKQSIDIRTITGL